MNKIQSGVLKIVSRELAKSAIFYAANGTAALICAVLFGYATVAHNLNGINWIIVVMASILSFISYCNMSVKIRLYIETIEKIGEYDRVN